MEEKDKDIKLNIGSEIEEANKTEIKISKRVSGPSVFIYKYFKIIILIEVLLVLLVGYFLIIGPQISQIKEYKKLTEWKKNDLSRAKDYQKDSQFLELEYEKLKDKLSEDIDRLHEILPPEKNLPELMTQIEALVENQGLKLGSIALDSSEDTLNKKSDLIVKDEKSTLDQEMIGEAKITLFVFAEEGSYKKVKNLLQALENHIRLIDVISFAFDSNIKSYSIIFKTYYLKNESR